MSSIPQDMCCCYCSDIAKETQIFEKVSEFFNNCVKIYEVYMCLFNVSYKVVYPIWRKY